MADYVLIPDGDYEGQYVALRSFTEREVVASGDDPVEVMQAAKEKGAVSPVIVYAPKDDITCIY